MEVSQRLAEALPPARSASARATRSSHRQLSATKETAGPPINDRGGIRRGSVLPGAVRPDTARPPHEVEALTHPIRRSTGRTCHSRQPKRAAGVGDVDLSPAKPGPGGSPRPGGGAHLSRGQCVRWPNQASRPILHPHGRASLALAALALEEFSQAFLPARFFSLNDLSATTLGGIAGWSLAASREVRSRRGETSGSGSDAGSTDPASVDW